MATIKKTISIPEELAEQVNALAPNFSATVEVALKEHLQHLRVQKALQSFGQWKDRAEDSVTIVNQLREEGNRKPYEDRSH